MVLDPAERAEASPRAVARALALMPPGLVLAFVGRSDEVDTEPLLEALIARDGSVALPRVVGETLVLHRVRSLELPVGFYGLREPDASAEVVGPEALSGVVVPGLAFDAAGNRLGRGKGYYDRLLTGLPAGVPTVGLTLERWLVPEVPMEGHDRRVDRVVTEARTI